MIILAKLRLTHVVSYYVLCRILTASPVNLTALLIAVAQPAVPLDERLPGDPEGYTTLLEAHNRCGYRVGALLAGGGKCWRW